MLLLTGRKHLGLLRESLLSLHNACQAIPRVRVVSDGTVSAAELREFLRWWPNTLETRDAEQLLAPHERKGRRALVDFARFHVMGKKMAAIVEACESGPVLYSDVDVLWFRDPAALQSGGNGAVTVTMCQDYQMSYDRQLIERLGLHSLESEPYVNAGLMWIRGNLWADTDLEAWLSEALKEYNFFSEQTMFAALAKTGAAPAWSPSKVACMNDDSTSLAPTYRRTQWIARHYVTTVRHLFWRDALSIRLGIRQAQH
jgi:nucleotide-diphospho-sugar transferase